MRRLAVVIVLALAVGGCENPFANTEPATKGDVAFALVIALVGNILASGCNCKNCSTKED